jgi:hypothetical protein
MKTRRLFPLAIVFLLVVASCNFPGPQAPTQLPTAPILPTESLPTETLPPPLPSDTPLPPPSPTITMPPPPTGTATQSPTTTLTVYFLDSNRYTAGTPPYEAAVTRIVPHTVAVATRTLQKYFEGPTADEQAAGLVRLMNGFTGFSSISIQNGVARVYMTGGPCNSEGATYTIANLLYANLTQFSTITWVKIYDQDGHTEQPTGQSNSIPACLEP